MFHLLTVYALSLALFCNAVRDIPRATIFNTIADEDALFKFTRETHLDRFTSLIHLLKGP